MLPKGDWGAPSRRPPPAAAFALVAPMRALALPRVSRTARFKPACPILSPAVSRSALQVVQKASLTKLAFNPRHPVLIVGDDRCAVQHGLAPTSPSPAATAR